MDIRHRSKILWRNFAKHCDFLLFIFIAAANVALGAVTIPAWTPFLRYAQNLGNADEIFPLSSVICHLSSVIKLVSFYIAYAGCAIIDNIFIGLGKTGDTAVNSLANFHDYFYPSY